MNDLLTELHAAWRTCVQVNSAEVAQIALKTEFGIDNVDEIPADQRQAAIEFLQTGVPRAIARASARIAQATSQASPNTPESFEDQRFVDRVYARFNSVGKKRPRPSAEG